MSEEEIDSPGRKYCTYLTAMKYEGQHLRKEVHYWDLFRLSVSTVFCTHTYTLKYSLLAKNKQCGQAEDTVMK